MFLEIKCITDHEEFQPIVLHKGTLWTALVALHDQESHLIKQWNELPNRYPINSLLPRAHSIIVLFYEPSHSRFDEEKFFSWGGKQ